MATKPKDKSKSKRASTRAESEKKWTKPLIDAGFTILPSMLITKQAALSLEPLDFNIVMHIVNHWWKADTLPFPSKRRMADAMGVDTSTVRRRIAKLEALKLIERVERRDPDHKGQTSNFYRLNGIIERLTPLANDELNARKKRKEEREARQKRKKALRATSEVEDE